MGRAGIGPPPPLPPPASRVNLSKDAPHGQAAGFLLVGGGQSSGTVKYNYI